MSGADDLTGRWHGFYTYADGRSCAFEAQVRDHGGELVGVTHEVAEFGPAAGGTLTASIEGRRKGSAVDFAKTYDDVALAHYAIHYAGTLGDGGNEIEGTWSVPGVHSGTFLMIREGGIEAEEEREAAEEVPR
ncbi:MAG: hypothetical protein JO013_00950 [Alphaproteobacteria bacterium]|nr:hypothetical protein [Alphaproteobacteria bacterium]